MAGIRGASRTFRPQGGRRRANVQNADLISESMRKYLDYRASAKEIPPEWARVGGENRCASRDAANSRRREIEEDDGRGEESDWEDQAAGNWRSWRHDFARVSQS